MNRERKSALIAKIKELEGLDDADKAALIELLRTKTYGLVWENKPENVEEKLRTKLPVLYEVKDKAIVSDAPDAPNHVVIEGDNLEALTALSYTHAGKVDVIYIDPPYNTGKNDFKYNDEFVDVENEYRHSKWLSFMYKRLKIAKQLLSDIGVIFISIDDKEFSQLRAICNELFGESNFVGEIIWESATDNNPTQIGIDHEYVLCYAKLLKNLSTWQVISDKATIIKDRYTIIKQKYPNDFDKQRKELRSWIRSVKKSNEFDLSGVSHYDYIDEKGVFYPGNSANTKPGGYDFDIVHPLTKKICKKPTNGYRWPQSTFNDAVLRSDVLWGQDENTIPRIKKRIETATELLKSVYYEDGRKATNDLTNILGDKKFNNPKPLRLISKIIRFSSKTTSLVLDFFAGSGTTMHAVMQLNEEDGGHRQCILVNNKENNICEEVTYERNKRVINGYTTPNGVAVEGLKNNSLRYYKMDFIPRERTASNRRKLMAACTDLLCIKNDVYIASDKIFSGLKDKDVRYFEERGKRMLVIYNEAVISQVVYLLKYADAGETPIKVYVFSYGSDPYADEFIDVADKVELCALPQAIYDAYRRVLPKEVERNLEVENEEEVNHD